MYVDIHLYDLYVYAQYVCIYVYIYIYIYIHTYMSGCPRCFRCSDLVSPSLPLRVYRRYPTLATIADGPLEASIGLL